LSFIDLYPGRALRQRADMYEEGFGRWRGFRAAFLMTAMYTGWAARWRGCWCVGRRPCKRL